MLGLLLAVVTSYLRVSRCVELGIWIFHNSVLSVQVRSFTLNAGKADVFVSRWTFRMTGLSPGRGLVGSWSE